MKKTDLNQLKLLGMEELSIQEKGKLIRTIKEKYGISYREQAKICGKPYATIQDWAAGAKRNVGKDIHISFQVFYRKIKDMKPQDVTDWGRLEMIKQVIDNLLLYKGK